MSAASLNRDARPAACLLLILERDLRARFAVIERELGTDKHVLSLQNVTKRGWLPTLIARFKMRHELMAAYRELREKLQTHRIVLLSNVEGFIAKNMIRWIRRDFPDVTLVQLQHGIFAIKRRKRMSGMLFNTMTRFITGVDLLGEGFVNRDVDYYLVYNSYYKSLLTCARVSPDAVLAASGFLKGHLAHRRRELLPAGSRAVFLLQPLSALGITDEQSEAWLLERVIRWLSSSYEHVVIKHHPYRDVMLPVLPANCVVGTGTVVDLAAQCAVAVSFFSEALLECEYLGLQSIAIRSSRLAVDADVYRLFQYTVEVTADGQLSLSQTRRDFQYYESEVSTADELLQKIGGRTVRAERGAAIDHA